MAETDPAPQPPTIGRAKRPGAASADQLHGRLQHHASTARGLRANLPLLQRQFTRLGRLDQLFEHLWATRSISFSRLDTIGDLAKLAAPVGRLGEVLAEFRARKASGELHHLRWDSNFTPGWYRFTDVEFTCDLVRLKYEDIPLDLPQRPAALKEISSRNIIDPKLMQVLLDHRSDKSRAVGSWGSALRHAFALEHLINDTFEGPLRRPPEEFVDFAQIEALRATVGGEPALIVMFHGGFLQPLKFVYELAFPSGFRLQAPAAANERHISTDGDKTTALFAALRSLQDGHVMLMAPDYWVGESKFSIDIAGLTQPVAPGAPFLAYESGCRVFWFDAVRDGARITPRLLDMIRRQPGEKYKAFCVRFFERYSAMIEALLSGPPENIVLRHRWARLIAQGQVPISAAGR